MYDINEEINNIIFKYDIDKEYPMFRKTQEAKKILYAIIEKIVCSGKEVVFIVGSELERLFLQKMNGSCSRIKLILYNDLVFLDDKKKQWEKISKVYIIAFNRIEKYDVLLKKQGIMTEWLYDIFAQKGLFFDREFFKFGHFNEVDDEICSDRTYTKLVWQNSMHRELFYEKNSQKENALGNCFFLALLMRDFCCAEYHIELMRKKQIEDERFFNAWCEVKELLKDIKQRLCMRKQRDVVIYWLDALSYGEETEMTYLSGKIEKSTCFTNAFTVTPNTFPTLKSMFCELKQVDDRGYKVTEITDENSKLLRNIRKQGYVYKIIGGHMPGFDLKYYSKSYFETYTDITCSLELWNVWAELLAEEKPMLLLVHMLEAHAPCLNTKITKELLKGENTSRRREDAKKEMDQQLEFYDCFLPESAVRIYLSDHGYFTDELMERVHVLLNIFDIQKKEKKINSMFSFLDFNKLLIDVLKNVSIEGEKYEREFIEIQDVDFYNREILGNMIRNRGEVGWRQFGYKGIITNEDIYVRFSNGMEWTSKREKMEAPDLLFLPPIQDEERLSKFRIMLRPYPLEFFEDEKFTYSMYMHKLFEKQKKFLIENLSNVIGRLMDEFLKKFADDSVGIRLGGRHSKILYMQLSMEAKKKIKCFIDRSTQCECASLGVPILTLEESFSAGVEGIVLSSFINLQMLRKEAENYKDKVQVIDFYQLLESKGIICERDFYLALMPDEIWNVGFPF